jgi:hypothetical protein
MKKLSILVLVALAVALAAPSSSEAAPLSQVKKVTASDAQADDWFGYSVAVSGDIAVVGARYEDAGGGEAGAAYVFGRNAGGTNNWGQVKKLTASDAQADDWFGYSVAVSGDIAVVGAHYEDAGGGEAGAAYVFGRNAGGTNNWGQVKKLTASDAEWGDHFGVDVAVSGDIAVVGAEGEDAGGSNAGAAYVFGRNAGGTNNWGQVKKLTASDAQAEDLFGLSVAVSGDIVVVGAYGEDTGGSDAGAAYVFRRDQGGADNWGQVKKLTASDAEWGDYFGYSVAVSGDIAVVAAYGEAEAGAAYVFGRNSGGTNNWGQVKKVTASDAEGGDCFGSSVAVSGDIAVVGALGEDAGVDDEGAGYVFGRNSGGADNWGQVEKLTASDAQVDDEFGVDVAVSGDIAVVGAEGEDAGGSNAGAAYVFQSPSVGGIAELPALAGISGQEAVASAEGSGWSAGDYAALAGGLAAAAFAIAVGGWYARRRWLR